MDTGSDIYQQLARQQQQHHYGDNPSTQFNNLNSHEHQIAVEIIIKIIQRNYSRHFIKRLMFAYIENLRKSQTVIIRHSRPMEQINWPFRDLYLNKNRTQEQNQLFQFVNLCAQMIQSNFKAYLTRKRHLAAYAKAKRTNDLLLSFVRRWKVYRTYNCNKIVEIRAKIREIQKQIDQQQENFTNRDAKKLKGLYKYLQIYTKMFKQTFQLLMQTGMWTLQQNMKPFRVKKPSPPPKQQRVRQFRGANRETKKSPIQIQQNASKLSEDLEIKKQNIDHNASNEFINSFPNKSQWSTTATQDRPIKATGCYKINEEELSKSYVEPKPKKDVPEDMLGKDQGQEQPKAKERIKKTQELQKRTKYDPRKAIQQQKNRKKDQIAQKKNQSKVIDPVAKEVSEIIDQPIKVQLKKTNQTKNQREQSRQQPQNQQQQPKPKKVQTKQKKVEPKQKPVVELENSSSKQTKLVKKVSSKVDCWVNKKQPQPEWVKQYKSRLQQNSREEESGEKILNNLKKSVEKSVSVKKEDRSKILNVSGYHQKDEIEQRIRIRLKSEDQEKERVQINESWKERQRQIQDLKQKQDEFAGKRKNSTHNLQQQIKAILQKKNNMANLRKKQAHRPIEELEETYNKHYGDRYQNLIPKLNLLSVARNQQKKRRIPIIQNQNQQFDNWFESLYHSSHYWKMISQQDRIYKSFLHT